MIRCVPRKLFLGIRIPPELKKDLEAIADAEERSVSQICELMLRRGVVNFKKEGTKYLKQSGSRLGKVDASE
jgi:predicted transcriptional regulator